MKTDYTLPRLTSASYFQPGRARRSQALPLFPLLASLGLAVSTGARAEGFRNPPPGAFSLGRAGGRIAQVDDSSAVTQNPANLMDLKEAEFEFTPSIVYLSVDYQSPTGASTQTKDPWHALPNLFASLPLKQDRFAAGVGITVPYGLGNAWETAPTSPFHYTAPHFTELKTINVNPTFAARLCDHVTFGAGLDVMWSELTIKQFYPWLIFPGSTGIEPDGVAKIKGDGYGVGGNLGLTWQITERQRLAVTYRSTMSVDYDGSFKISNITPTAAALGASARSDFATRIRFPNIVAVGYGLQVTDTIRIEADVEWLQFSKFSSLDLSVGNNAFLLPATSVPENWKDTFTAGIGGDWKFAESWVLRAGYQYYQSPVPDSTLSPTIPDANQNVLTVGLGYRHGQHSVEGGYGLDFYDRRNITSNLNPAFNGTYDVTVHLFSFAYRYAF
jgi:long-chain fatty acid transport protein